MRARLTAKLFVLLALPVGVLHAFSGPDPGIAGRMHPLLIHFPVAWILLAAGTEWVALFPALRFPGKWPTSPRVRRRWLAWGRSLGNVSFVLLILAAFSSCAAAATGYLLSLEKEEDAQLVLHGRLAYATLALVAMALGARLLSVRHRSQPWRMASAFLLSAAALMVAFTGHAGGTLIFGEGYPWVGPDGP